MHIGVDLDSVLADFIHPIIRFHNEVYKTDTKLRDHKTFDLSPVWKCSYDEVVDRINEFYKSPYYDLMKPMKGSRRVIKKLKNKHRFSVITSRPYHVEGLTRAWLEKYFPKVFYQIHHTNQASKKHEPNRKKSEVCLALGAEVMIEDNLDFATDCASSGIEVLLMSMPWNKTDNLHKGIKRVYSWKEIESIL